MLLVAIGIVPATEWVGADVRDFDTHPNIHVAGDAASGDHWEQATHSGKAVANAILGKDPVPMPVTTWWSDVHGVRIQGLGDPMNAGELQIDGDMAARLSFTAVALRDGVPVAATAVARPRDVPRLRKLLTDPPQSAPEAEHDPNTPPASSLQPPASSLQPPASSLQPPAPSSGAVSLGLYNFNNKCRVAATNRLVNKSVTIHGLRCGYMKKTIYNSTNKRILINREPRQISDLRGVMWK